MCDGLFCETRYNWPSQPKNRAALLSYPRQKARLQNTTSWHSVDWGEAIARQQCTLYSRFGSFFNESCAGKVRFVMNFFESGRAGVANPNSLVIRGLSFDIIRGRAQHIEWLKIAPTKATRVLFFGERERSTAGPADRRPSHLPPKPHSNNQRIHHAFLQRPPHICPSGCLVQHGPSLRLVGCRCCRCRCRDAVRPADRRLHHRRCPGRFHGMRFPGWTEGERVD